ncbi:MAG TPA: FGGY family carbohydrate kinase, partial [Aggregatilineales bacterium]|nr:FGGY family carbohydrate kinase [Aggregatilineales bacterium]
KIDKNRIAGVALTTQRGTIVVVDKNGEPLRPAISWLDQRRTEGLKPLGGKWGFLFKLARATATVAHVQAEAELNWIKTYEPEIWAKTHKIVLL